MKIFGVFCLFGVVQGLILVLFFLLDKKKYSITSNQFLIVLLLICVFVNTNGLIDEMGLSQTYPVLRLLPIKFHTLIAPIVYFFIQFLIHPNYKIKPWEYGLYFVYILDFFYRLYLSTNYFNGSIDVYADDFLSAYYNFIIAIEILGGLLYLVISIQLIGQLRSYEKSLLEEYAEINDKSLKWLLNSLIIGTLLTLVWLGTAILDYLQIGIQSDERLIWVGVSLLVYWFSSGLLIRPELFVKVNKMDISPIVVNEPSPVLSHEADANVVNKPSPVLSHKTDEYYQKLTQLMLEEALYREPNFNLNSLAKEMGLSKGYLSLIINQKEGKNFFEFVNYYRIEDVKAKLRDESYKHYSLMGIAEECGFKSKSTFYAVFKKMTGMTPSQLR